MPSLIQTNISKIKNLKLSVVQHENTFLLDYKRGVDLNTRKLIYITAKVTSNSLDKGFDLLEESLRKALQIGIRPGDYGKQYIPTRLGGDGIVRNVFPLNKDVDVTKWNANQDLVYNHVKSEKNNGYAILHFGVVYDKKLKEYPYRPFKIYYIYELYQDDKMVHQIEGVLKNESPKVTNKNFVRDALEMPYVF
uniref:Uncharacterized protein n=1 Tax=Panagrolaimus sp. ES5 TaxID=591445 RepID=A0AC34FA18_9BILA